MLAQFRPAMSLIIVFTLLTGLALPLGFVGLGEALFPFQANGSLIQKNGVIIGSAMIGQNFTQPKYFWGRPSALMGTDPKDSTKQISTPYDASESGASNLAPTSAALHDRVKAAVGTSTDVPGDAVTTSASGLDPDISPENAATQIARVAKARGMSVAAVQAVVDQHTQAPTFGLLGGARVNVLQLNLALDDLK
jgi:K+-transporting ATPase ATPase C chain